MQDSELWENIDLSSIRSVILAIDKHETKINAARYLRSNNYSGSIIALTIQKEEQKDLKEAGATAVCLPLTQAGRKLAELSLSDDDGPEELILDPKIST